MISISLGLMLALSASPPIESFCQAAGIMFPAIFELASPQSILRKGNELTCQSIPEMEINQGRTCEAAVDENKNGVIRCLPSFIQGIEAKISKLVQDKESIPEISLTPLLFVAAHELGHLAIADNSNAGSFLNTDILTNSELSLKEKIKEALRRDKSQIKREAEVDEIALEALNRVLSQEPYIIHAAPSIGIWAAGNYIRRVFGVPEVLARGGISEWPVPRELINLHAAQRFCKLVGDSGEDIEGILPLKHPDWASRGWMVGIKLASKLRPAATMPTPLELSELVQDWSKIQAFILKQQSVYIQSMLQTLLEAAEAYDKGRLRCSKPTPTWKGRKLVYEEDTQCPRPDFTWEKSSLLSTKPTEKPPVGPWSVYKQSKVYAFKNKIQRHVGSKKIAFALQNCEPVFVETMKHKSVIQCRQKGQVVLVDWNKRKGHSIKPIFKGKEYTWKAEGISKVDSQLILQYQTRSPGYLLEAFTQLNQEQPVAFPIGPQPQCDELQQLGAGRPFKAHGELFVAVQHYLCRKTSQGWECEDPREPLHDAYVSSQFTDKPQDSEPPMTWACGPGPSRTIMCLTDVGQSIVYRVKDGKRQNLYTLKVSLEEKKLVSWCSSRRSAGVVWISKNQRKLAILKSKSAKIISLAREDYVTCSEKNTWIRGKSGIRKL